MRCSVYLKVIRIKLFISLQEIEMFSQIPVVAVLVSPSLNC